MPALPPAVLVDVILDAIQESGESGIPTSGVRVHPRRFGIAGPSGPTTLWVYAWTLTPGGRPQLQHEYRIQMTCRPPLAMNPQGLTVLMGYDPSLQMFAGFDIERHRDFTGRSPSVQIDIRTLRAALQDGLAFHRKDNEEIAVGIRRDQFMTYARNARVLHRTGRHAATVEMLKRASSLQAIEEAELAGLTAERRRLVHTVSRMSRAANFRQQVLHAYGQRCAVTRMQLRLVDAAHILPVAAADSVDDVRNGIALSPTYHRAFDSGLIFLDEAYTMRVSFASEESIVSLGLDGGLEAFRASLGRIHLPQDRRQWPNARFIKKANRFRRIEAA